ncbi:MAG: transketolase [Bacteroidetes bacterium]|nr:transketolase [Bacteroidota bacterium]
MVRSNTFYDTTELAKRIRIHALRMTNSGGSSHIGSIFSVADILSVLYGRVLHVDPTEPKANSRDRFILSKGHAGAGVYAALGECGFFKLEILKSHDQDGSLLSGHVSHKGIPGVEVSTGSLGHGLSIGAGMAFAGLTDGSSHRVFVVLSDGECDEGSTWEAILFASHHRLSNLVAIVDYNKIQSLASTQDTLDLEPFANKWSSFGWAVREIDGHNHAEILGVCRELPFSQNKPNCIIAHTVKGKGVSFMENSVLWHYRTARGAEFDAAMTELMGGLNEG